MVDSSRRRVVRASGVLAAAALAGCSAVPSLDALADRGSAPTGDGGERAGAGSGDASTAGSNSGWADGPHDLPLSVRATGEQPRSFRVLVRTGATETFGETDAPTTDTSFTVPVDGPQRVEGAFPVPDDGRIVYAVLLLENGVVLGSHTVEVPEYHTAHMVEADVFADSVDWNLVVH